jgi:hypothetical protein
MVGVTKLASAEVTQEVQTSPLVVIFQADARCLFPIGHYHELSAVICRILDTPFESFGISMQLMQVLRS